MEKVSSGRDRSDGGESSDLARRESGHKEGMTRKNRIKCADREIPCPSDTEIDVCSRSTTS